MNKYQLIAGLLLLCLGACVGPSSNVSPSVQGAAVVKNAPTVLTMNFAQGQILSLISVAPKAGEAAAAVRQAYLTDAFGLAKPYGLKPVGTLPVAAAPAGDFEPEAISFFAWPGRAEEAAFRSQPRWPAIKATRPDGWNELRIHDVVLDADLTLSFANDKTYTMATAWINPERPDDYDRYLSNIERAVADSGGRFIYQMVDPDFTALATGRGAPGRVTFVEWDTSDGLAGFQKTQGFKDNVSLLQSGTTGFELLILAPPKSQVALPGERRLTVTIAQSALSSSRAWRA